PLLPTRPGVDIRNRCLIEGVQPDHVPSVPSDPRSGSHVPALAPPTNECRRRAGPGTRTASRQNTVNNFSRRWHKSPASLFPPQIRDAPNSP
ncbi:MAG: hypothetical protein OXH93_16875, partial [Caldilineaceae bacterium]|nr:hypothetical protein [Caldilineaceae bacterium]